jgi:CubicO group peptidase (beta-lactamase class C family)
MDAAAILAGSAAHAVQAAGAASAASPDMPAVVPESVGVDSAPLVRMSQWLRNDKMDVRSLVVVKDGKIVFERYGDGLTRENNYELYSVTKTITALLTGILVGEGKLNPSTKVAPMIAQARPDLAGELTDKQTI